MKSNKKQTKNKKMEEQIENCIVIFIGEDDEMINCDRSYFEKKYYSYKIEKNAIGTNVDWKTFWKTFKQKCSLRQSPENQNKVNDISRYIFGSSIIQKENIEKQDDKECKTLLFVKLPHYIKGSKDISDIWKRNLWSIIIRQIQEMTLKNKMLSFTILFYEPIDEIKDLKSCTDDQFVMYVIHETFKFCNRSFNFVKKLKD